MSSRVTDPALVPVTSVPWRRVPQRTVHDTQRSAAAAPASEMAPDRSEELAAAELRGYQRGMLEGNARAQSELEPKMEQLRETIAGLAVYRDRLRREAELDLVKLALGIARRILHRELSVDPDAVHAMIKVALDKLKHGELLRVRYHPSLDKALRGQLAGASAGQSVELHADAGLDPGDLVLDTARGSLDVSMDSQIREMERFLLDRVGGER